MVQVYASFGIPWTCCCCMQLDFQKRSLEFGQLSLPWEKFIRITSSRQDSAVSAKLASENIINKFKL